MALSSAHDDLDVSSSSSPPSSFNSTNAVAASSTTFTAICSNDDSQTSAPILSDARDFIMDRFLPAAHTIACDSPLLCDVRSPLFASPSAVRRSSPLRSPLLSRALTPPFLSRDRTVTTASDFHLDDIVLDDYGDNDEDRGPRSTKTCGMFTFSCLSSDSNQPKQTKKSPQSSRRRTLADALREDNSEQEVDRTSGSRRNLMPSTSANGAHRRRSPLHLLFTMEDTDSPNFYDAASTLSSSVSVSGYRNRPTTSPFLQSKTFLGMPRDRSMKDVNSGADGSPSLFETPRTSVDDTKIILSKNGHVYLSPFSSVLLKLNSPTRESDFQIGALSPSYAYSATRTAAGEGPRADSNPAKVAVLKPVASDPVLQQPLRGENGGNLVCEKNNVPTFETEEWKKADISGAMLSPPLPKPPSESWLCRAIPFCPADRSSPISDPHKASVLQAEKMSSSDAPKDAKWEKIVKGSHIQRGHLRFSKELVHHLANPFGAGVI